MAATEWLGSRGIGSRLVALFLAVLFGVVAWWLTRFWFSEMRELRQWLTLAVCPGAAVVIALMFFTCTTRGSDRAP